MSDNPYTEPVECYAEGYEGDLLDCAITDLTGATFGEPLFGVLAGGAILLALYIAGEGHPAPPTIGTILIGSLMVPMLPGNYSRVAHAIVAFGIAFGVVALSRRWVME